MKCASPVRRARTDPVGHTNSLSFHITRIDDAPREFQICVNHACVLKLRLRTMLFILLFIFASPAMTMAMPRHCVPSIEPPKRVIAKLANQVKSSRTIVADEAIDEVSFGVINTLGVHDDGTALGVLCNIMRGVIRVTNTTELAGVAKTTALRAGVSITMHKLVACVIGLGAYFHLSGIGK
tara:strand:+ start:225 stop:767 length:543 start_codon:yes stop_codon:yes gene_type:complete